MKTYLKIALSFIFLLSNNVNANEVNNWLQIEIDKILNAYKDTGISNSSRFSLVEETVNNNFAGAGIAKFAAGESWGNASKKTKKEYINLFKRHLALSVASLMQGYSNQEYKLLNTEYDSQNNVNMIDMKIINESGNILITWRVKKSKEKFYIIDLLVADISLVVTKRSEFNSMLKKSNYDLDKFNEILNSQNELSYNKLIE